MNMSRQFTSDVYTAQPVPRPKPAPVRPGQTRRRRSFRVPQNAFDATAPEILRVSIR